MNKISLLTISIAILLLVSCRFHDTQMWVSREKYEEMLSKNALPKEESKIHAPIPRLSKIVAMPSVPKIYDKKLISVSATDDIPIIDLLLEIGRVANVDVIIDKNIEGGLFINVQNLPLIDVLNKIADMSDLRYTEANSSFIFEYDDPYLHTYNVSFLNVTRQGSSSMSVSTSVVSGSVSSGSSGSLSSSMTDTFWTDMVTDVTNITKGVNQASQIKRAKASDTQASQIATDTQSNGNNVKGDSTSTNSTTSTGQSNNQSSSGSSGSTPSAIISLNKTAGTLNVFTSGKGHKRIKEYLDALRKKVTAQVLIEIKIVEVSLSKNFEFGVDFTQVANYLSTNSTGISSLSDTTFVAKSGKFGYDGSKTISATLNALDKFGTSKILASPRLTAINNQPAVMTFADNEVFFNISVTTTSAVIGGDGKNIIAPQVNVTSTPQTIPVGIVLTLQPSIDLDNQTTLLTVRPTLSRVKDSKEDPGFTFLVKQNKVTDVPTNKIPITSVRELDSVANMADGDVMIMGGFTERSKAITEAGVPILSRIPVVGWFFSKTAEVEIAKEIVILIKTTIINEKTGIPKYDKFFYKNFFNDPREFEF